MRLLMGSGALALLILGTSGTAVAAAPDPEDPLAVAVEPVNAGKIKNDQFFTSLRISPGRPRQDSDVRLIVRCPKKATDAVVFSKVLNDAGVRRHSTALGIGLNEDKYGHDTEDVGFDAPLGPRRVWMKCIKIDVDKETRSRKIEVISRARTAVLVRRYSKWQH
ncbi:hypothetical protein [Streptosporangium sp. NPDC004631]